MPPRTPDTPQAQAQSQAQAQACDRCHRRKTRCDKRHPECGSCRKARATCVYSERAKDPVYRRSFVERLERRIHQLEAANRTLTAAAAPSPSRDHWAAASPQRDEDSSQSRTAIAADDVANEVSFLSTSAGGDRQFLGSTSGILLASLVKAGFAVTVERPAEPASTTSISHGAGSGEWGIDDRALPPEQLARSLIEAYLAHDHLSYPFLHPRAVRETVNRIYSDANFSRTHAFELFMFNMILAIATSQVYKFNWQVLPDAETHHQRATSYLNQVLCEGGLRALQAMLLLCQFRLSSSTKDASGSLWHIVGIAARMCFELGLHREAMYRLTKPSGPEVVPCLSPQFEENEVRRRCFWSVFSLDRIVSITLGRPLAVCVEDIDVELPTDDLDEATSPAALSTGDDQDSSRIAPSYRTSLFVHLVRYRDICGRCLTSLHRSSRVAAQSEADLYQARNSLAAELQAWRTDTNNLNLPEIDLLTPLAEARSSFRSKAWYELLYHNGVLLLYRPSASTVSSSGDGSSLQHVFSAAKQSITLYAYLLRSRKINFSWITMHAVFMAGLSYVYALSRHFRERRRRPDETRPDRPRQHLSEEPAIVDIVNCSRACSNVLVAVSERCNAQKNCHEVFDRLCDAVLADAVAALSGPPILSNAVIETVSGATNPPETSAPDMQMRDVLVQPPGPTSASYEASVDIGFRDPDIARGRQVVPGVPFLAVDNALRDCFPDLQRMYDAQWGDDAILQLSTDWLGEIGPSNGLIMDEWNLGS
ncbi:fungal-specific transcription factor domain-containing protein [Mariannaea sp. PMI_226]|nr:fungal-specific transcription factor domain-containing protein [Mariannaea sp. PMI_226]